VEVITFKGMLFMDQRTELMEKLLLKDIKPSYQRLRIFQYLLSHRTHPTVDEIHHALVAEMPTLSKTTVYNTLKLLVERGLAQLITIEEVETRYDGNISFHGHFKCSGCQRIYDFPITQDQFFTDALAGFQIHEKSLYFKGICKDCIKNKSFRKREVFE